MTLPPNVLQQCLVRFDKLMAEAKDSQYWENLL